MTVKQADLKLLHRVDYSYLTQDEFDFFVTFCEEKGLNPWLRHIKPEVRHNAEAGRNEIKMITTVDALRIIAVKTGEYEGRKGPTFFGDSGLVCDLWMRPEPPNAAQVSVFRKGFREPIVGTAMWDAHCQFTEEAGKRVPTEFWLRMGSHMLGKCAEAHALRAAFPERLGGLYINDEMQGNGRTPPRPRPAGEPPAGEGSARGWNPDVPASMFQFHLALSELGLQDPRRREQVIGEFRQSHPRIADDPAQFYQLVLASVRADPERFGISREAVLA